MIILARPQERTKKGQVWDSEMQRETVGMLRDKKSLEVIIKLYAPQAAIKLGGNMIPG